jgi:nitrite reductase (NO-forming)
MKEKNKYNLLFLLTLLLGLILLNACGESGSEKIIGEEKAKLTHAPFVPPPINRDHPTKVIIDMDVRELVKPLSDGVEYVFWTFGGDVPGEFIRVREGDLIEFRLHNHPSSKLPHNIDLHAVTGPGGGAESSFTAPGHTSVFSFTAKNAGLYVYHCATAPVGLHIANGMYGLILVEPKEGLPPVDKEYYVMQSEFYTEGNYGAPGLQPFSLDKAVEEHPDYVVFNGAVGALVGDKSLKANVGDKIRLYVGNGGPNLVSSFHVIGEIFDLVHTEGGTVANQKNVQTTLVPAGGSAIVEFTVDVPGRFILVDHSIFRAFNKGALGMLEVRGEENEKIYSGKQADEIYDGSLSLNKSNINSFTGEFNSQTQAGGYVSKFSDGDGSVDPELLKAAESGKSNSNKKPDFASMGQSIYNQTCFACHQADGKGIPNVFPPVANSDWIKKNKEGSIKAVVHGKQGEMTVNGKKYNGIMPPQNLNDEQVAAVLTYVYKKFNNSNITVGVDEVKKARSSK